MKFLNKLTALLCSGVMTAAAVLPAAAGVSAADPAVTFRAQEISGAPGQDVKYSIEVENEGAKISALGMKLYYADGLTFECTDDRTPVYETGEAADGIGVSCLINQETNVIAMASLSSGASEKSGVFVTFTVHIPEDAENDTHYPVKLELDECWDIDGAPIECRTSDGYICAGFEGTTATSEATTEAPVTVTTTASEKQVTNPSTVSDITTTKATTASAKPTATETVTTASSTKDATGTTAEGQGSGTTKTVTETTAKPTTTVTTTTTAKPTTTVTTTTTAKPTTTVTTTTTAKPTTTTVTTTSTAKPTTVTTTVTTTTTAKPTTTTTTVTTTVTTVTTTVTTTTVTTTTTVPLASVHISKQDQFGEIVSDAVLSLSGKTVTGEPIQFSAASIEIDDESLIVNAVGDALVWITGENTPLICNLADGVYTLREITVPSGYKKANDVTFIISGGKLTVVDGKRVDSDTVIIMTDQRVIVTTTTTAATTTTTTTTVTTTAGSTESGTGTSQANESGTTATNVTKEGETTNGGSQTTASVTTAVTTTEEFTITTVISDFQWGIDNWGFINSKKTLSRLDKTNKAYYYEITDEDKALLFSRLSNIEVQKINSMLSGKSKGNCYGMSVTAILQTYGFFKPSDLVEGVNNLGAIDSTNINEKVKSSISYYQMLQYTKEVSQEMYYTARQPEDIKLKKLMDSLKAGRPTLVGYTFDREDGTKSGHAVVAYGIKKNVVSKTISTTERYQFDTEILIYNNLSNDNTERYNIYVDTAHSLWCIPMTDDKNELDKTVIMNLNQHRSGNITLVTSDPILMNCHGLFNGYQSYHYDSSAPYYAQLNMIPLKGDFRLGVSNDPYDGTLAANDDDGDILLTANCFAAEDEDEIYYTASMDSDCSYYVAVNEPEQIRATMEYEHCLLNASCEKADKMIVSPRARIALEHSIGDYTLSMVMDEGYHETIWHTLDVSGKDGGSLLLTNYPDGKGFLLTGESLNNVTVRANNNDKTTSAVTFSTEYKKVLIYQINPCLIGIAVDTDGNGTYETTITNDRGDVDEDGEVTATDAQIVLMAYTEALASGKQDLSGYKFTAADVDIDKEITAGDAQYILIYFVQSNVVGEPKTWDELMQK